MKFEKLNEKEKKFKVRGSVGGLSAEGNLSEIERCLGRYLNKFPSAIYLPFPRTS